MDWRVRALVCFAGGALLAACGSGGSAGADGGPGDPDAGRLDAGRDDGGAGPDDGGSGEDDAGGDAGPPPDEAVRFVVMGDTGEGNEDQHMVADVIATVCAESGCDFAVLLGDNIYDSGVDGVDDTQWQTKFEEPYADLDMPFYAVMGNHDYGGEDPILGTEQGGLGNEWDKGPIAVMYSEVSDKWIMPDTFYTFTWGNVGFIMLDTNSLLWDDTTHGDQRAWYDMALMEVSDADWVFGAGHHPYLSNGRHGNAGSYESIEIGGIDVEIPIEILNGGHVEDFFENTMCGSVDVYFAGHDHDREWLDENDQLCGAEMIISGAGAKVRDFEGRGNAYHWQDDSTEGFLYAVVEGDTFTGRFYDKTGEMQFERTFTKSR